jgi:glycine dehydrogenase
MPIDVHDAPAASSPEEATSSLAHPDQFPPRHVGPSADEVQDMLDVLGVDSLEELTDQAVPAAIRTDRALDLPEALTESELLERARALGEENDDARSFIGMGYYGTVTPPVIQRDILENPSWYTQYTPYQAEISQGRLQALLNFQTVTIDLTGLEIANASLLDEATAAAEAMMMLDRSRKAKGDVFFVDEACHPQTIEVVKGRADPIGVEIVVGDFAGFDFGEDAFGALVQYPTTGGEIRDYKQFCDDAHENDAFVACAADLMALTLLEAPGEWGADVCVGSSQRFGVPMGYGGPHAAFFSCREQFKRQVPGRMIGVSKDEDGDRALRMALQTREQHIRRGRATSNICTAQVLLAVMAGMYAVYHGPEGLRKIAGRIHRLTRILADGLQKLGVEPRHHDFFDTLRLDLPDGTSADALRERAEQEHINLRYYEDGSVGIALDEQTGPEEVDALLELFTSAISQNGHALRATDLAEEVPAGYDGSQPRQTRFLEHPVFHRHQSETEMTRYIHALSEQDLSLTHSMIPLGSCTMKLNPTAALMPVTMPAFAGQHPFAPTEQNDGYHAVIDELSGALAEITGLPGVSLQPNSGASGEYTGLLMIRAYHRSRGDTERNTCLIPESAHGTNPASASMVGMDVVTIDCDEQGNIDVDDLRAKAEDNADALAALMVTYPSTHGVFEEDILEITEVIHENGGQVYMDGANMNAQVGLCRPGEYGIDVCHLNLHKTFSIPHGGGGPGVGPICAADHLAPFLPGHPLGDEAASENVGGEEAIPAVSAAPHGSALILLISWAYIKMLGPEGLTASSETAILNANYLKERLAEHYDIVYTGREGRVAHEFILDLRPFRSEIEVSEQDVAKRLMDYGFHAPTMSWPVVGTLMVEPTESESKAELDRFARAMATIRRELAAVEDGNADAADNVLTNAPHPAELVCADDWAQPYGREKAAYPAEFVRERKFWPRVRRVDDAYGDRNLVCACPPVEAYGENGQA